MGVWAQINEPIPFDQVRRQSGQHGHWEAINASIANVKMAQLGIGGETWQYRVCVSFDVSIHTEAML